MPELENLAGLAADHWGLLSAELERQQTLEAVLAWARRFEPPRRIAEIVTQDEFTHDVVLPYENGGYLVYDTT